MALKIILLSLLILACLFLIYLLVRRFRNIKKRLWEDYGLFLAEQYNMGKITKHQVDIKDPTLFPILYKETKKERVYIIVSIVVLCGLIAGFIGAFFAL